MGIRHKERKLLFHFSNDFNYELLFPILYEVLLSQFSYNVAFSLLPNLPDPSLLSLQDVPKLSKNCSLCRVPEATVRGPETAAGLEDLGIFKWKEGEKSTEVCVCCLMCR